MCIAAADGWVGACAVLGAAVIVLSLVLGFCVAALVWHARNLAQHVAAKPWSLIQVHPQAGRVELLRGHAQTGRLDPEPSAEVRAANPPEREDDDVEVMEYV